MATIFEKEMPASACPGCGSELDRTTSLYGAVPKPSDFTLCVECGALLVFTETMTLRAPTQAEMQVAESITPLVRARRVLLQMIYVRRFDPRWKDRPNG